ncbi:hypothetical protein [Pseudomonas phage Astolliot]|nr:hypothetical protein [Pseudomonas phage Astolliot]
MAILKYKDPFEWFAPAGVQRAAKAENLALEDLFKRVREMVRENPVKVVLGTEHPARKGMYKGRGDAFGEVQAIGRGMRVARPVRHIDMDYGYHARANAYDYPDMAAEYARVEEEQRVTDCTRKQYVEARMSIARDLIAEIPNNLDKVLDTLLNVYSLGIGDNKGTYIERNLTSHYFSEVWELLIDTGFVLLGSGAFSTVFEYDNRVFKLNIQSPYKTDGWYGYAMGAMKSNHPNCIKVHSIKNIGKLYCAEIEKLTPIFNPGSTCPYTMKEWFTKDDHGNVTKIMEWLNISYTSAVDLIMIVRRAKLETGGSLDIHGYNVMMRGDIIVISDPIAHADYDMGKYA